MKLGFRIYLAILAAISRIFATGVGRGIPCSRSLPRPKRGWSGPTPDVDALEREETDWATLSISGIAVRVLHARKVARGGRCASDRGFGQAMPCLTAWPGEGVVMAALRIVLGSFGAALLAVAATSSATGPASGGWQEPVDVALTDADLAEITNVMVQNAPILAASPGIKWSSASRTNDVIHASVIFYPHEESGGIGHAVNASCVKEGDAPWKCPSGQLRSYMQVPGQDFRMRVLGTVDYDSAIALVDVTGRALGEDATIDTSEVDTAVLICCFEEGGATVVWGTSEGYSRVGVTAKAIPGQSPREAAGWEVVGVEGGSGK